MGNHSNISPPALNDPWDMLFLVVILKNVCCYLSPVWDTLVKSWSASLKADTWRLRQRSQCSWLVFIRRSRGTTSTKAERLGNQLNRGQGQIRRFSWAPLSRQLPKLEHDRVSLNYTIRERPRWLHCVGYWSSALSSSSMDMERSVQGRGRPVIIA